MKEQLDLINHFRTASDPTTLLRMAVERFPSRIALASSFSMEDSVIIDMLAQIDRNARIIAVDTGRLPEETYECAERISSKYGMRMEWFFPEASDVEKLITTKGLFSFRESIENRQECCFLRKVVPIERALAGLDAWITGQRREHNPTRAHIEPCELDEAHSMMVKFNPLASWSYDQVKAYVAQNKVPYNRLYDQGYKSIGCAPCTRAVSDTEHERQGRWWWEAAEHKECGIHMASSHHKQP